MKIKPRLVAAAVLAILILVLVLQNTEVVSVRFFLWDFTMSSVILMLLTTLVGFVCGYLVARVLAARGRGTP